jgi:undecaprenyl-phosphate galactose phosphotransferase
MLKITNKTKKVFLMVLFACTAIFILCLALEGMLNTFLIIFIIPLVSIMSEGLVNGYSNQKVYKRYRSFLVFADTDEAETLIEVFRNEDPKNFYITVPNKFIKYLEGQIEYLEEILSFLDRNEIREVFISHQNISRDPFFNLLDELRKRKIKIKVSSKSFEVLNKNVGKPFNGSGRVVSLNNNYTTLSHVSKRITDFILSGIGIIVLSPVLLLIAILIKTTSRGPVIFKQIRIGKNGKPFPFYKFRSMYQLNGEDDERKEMMIKFIKENRNQSSDTKVINTSRVTWIGRILRRTSLDELPQLFNVLTGDMSLVGPRPCIPYEFDNYQEWHKKRVYVLPGCTGLWQVSGRSMVSFDDSILLDLCYVYTMNLFMDIKIILKTLPVMFFSKGGK